MSEVKAVFEKARPTTKMIDGPSEKTGASSVSVFEKAPTTIDGPSEKTVSASSVSVFEKAPTTTDGPSEKTGASSDAVAVFSELCSPPGTVEMAEKPGLLGKEMN